MIAWPAVAVFVLLFALVTVLGFWGASWRSGDLGLLDEWALAGRRFGTLVTWFLIGGDLYTAYTFIAIPALVYGQGALAFFTLPYTAIVYPIAFVFAPRFWTVAKKRGYITFADFARERYDSRMLSLAVAITGILATMPYIALQLVGIQVVIAAMGLGGSGAARDLPVIIAFVILAAYTYRGGIRAPALIAIVKDALIYVTVIVAIIVIPAKLGGLAHVLASADQLLHARPKPSGILLAPQAFTPYVTLAIGSALALFMYPHSIPAVLSAASANVIRRNMAVLPAYSVLLGFMALFGYAAIVAGIHPANSSRVVPDLFARMFPPWFAGFAFAAIAIGALVPAAIMSIAAANLFTRNVYREYINHACTARDEAANAKIVSLVVKLGALIFVLFAPVSYAIDLQLLAGGWMLQTFPALIVGLYTRWFHRNALLAGWVVGMILATALPVSQHFVSVYPLHVGGVTVSAFAALYALAVNFAVAAALTLVFDGLKVPRGKDLTVPSDYRDDGSLDDSPLVYRK